MKKKVVVLGGGVGGLSAGWMLARTGEYEVTVVERSSVTGGICATFQHEAFFLDYGPHKAYSVLPGILDELESLMGDEFLKHKKRNSIFMFNSFLEYPMRMTDLAVKMGPKKLFQCAVSAAGSMVRKTTSKKDLETYETYLINRFGRKLYELVFQPLAEKTWGEPSTLSGDIARTRIPSKSLLDVAMRVTGLKRESELTDAKYFYYPRRGFGRIPKRMEEEILKFGGTVLVNAEITKICQKRFSITEVQVEINGNSNNLPCDLLISSIPLDVLVKLLGGEEGSEINETSKIARKLQYRDTILVYIFLRRETVTDQHWIFFPEKDVIFGRVFEQKRMSPEMCPKGRTALCCDFTDYEDGTLCDLADEVLVNRCVADLEKVGLIEKSWVEKGLVKRLTRFYPRYDLSYKETIAYLFTSLKRFDNLIPTGRIGFYNYNNSDHCVDMAKFITGNLIQGKKPNQIWAELKQRVENYQIVD